MLFFLKNAFFALYIYFVLILHEIVLLKYRTKSIFTSDFGLGAYIMYPVR